MDHPPVNAITRRRGWFELADIHESVGPRQSRAGRGAHRRGPGFNAGIDIKEMQSAEGFEHLLGANRGCFAAFEAIYQCPVPTIAAVNDFCMGLGVGLVGSCDIIVASDRGPLRPPRGRQRCPRLRLAPGQAGAADEAAPDGLHLRARHRRRSCYEWGTVYRSVRAGRAAGRGARPSRPRSPPSSRGSCGRQGGAQPDRSVRPPAQLPPRAGLHLRAQPVRATATSAAMPSSTGSDADFSPEGENELELPDKRSPKTTSSPSSSRA